MKNIMLCIIGIFVIGCSKSPSSPDLKIHEKLSLATISIATTEGQPWHGGASIRKDWGTEVIGLRRQLPNLSEDVSITVSTLPSEAIAKVQMLHKERSDKMEERYKTEPIPENLVKINKGMGVTYAKQYVDYIGGLRCATYVISQSHLAEGVGSKYYQTNCNYFDIAGGAKNIHIDYRYTFAYDETKFADEKSQISITPTQMEEQFKKDIKAIFNSLQIHDIDKAKMQGLGLLHDKKYEIQHY